MRCPCCGKSCVKPAEEILANLDSIYMACSSCPSEPNLDKGISLRALPSKLERCGSCGKATLDAVMLDALRILVHEGLRDEDDSLRSVGSPLISVGYPLPYSPRLGPSTLMIVGEKLNKDAAEKIISRVPEVKGVILSKGVPGVIDSKKRPIENELLAGCDMRSDIILSIFGELVIYKSQSKVHIEFPRQSAPKMKILEGLPLAGKDIVDGLCGPGTLGLMCVLGGARRVVLNDIWLPAIDNTLLNLEVNKKILGIDEIEYPEIPSAALGGRPVLACRASGGCEIDVYHGDLIRLFSRAKPADLCLIDHFPGARIADLQAACRYCKETVII